MGILLSFAGCWDHVPQRGLGGIRAARIDQANIREGRRSKVVFPVTAISSNSKRDSFPPAVETWPEEGNWYLNISGPGAPLAIGAGWDALRSQPARSGQSSAVGSVQIFDFLASLSFRSIS